MTYADWTIQLLPEYQSQTTFRQDFTIADAFGAKAVRDTYRRAFSEWKDNVVYLTELVMVLNHKIWEHYEAGRHDLAGVYNELWEQADHYACSHLTGDDLSYFYRVTD